MSWQTLVILQIIVSSLLAIWVRHVSINSRKLAFSIGFISYTCIAVMGIIYSVLYQKSLPSVPNGMVWLYIFAEGILLPACWVLHFKLVSHIGASNGVVASTFYGLGTAFLGIILLGERLNLAFFIGTLLILGAVFISLNIKPDDSHPISATFSTKALLLLGALVSFSFGMFFEKKAINLIGAWDYAVFGWTMQFIGAGILYAIFGRGEIPKLTKKVVKNAAIVGVLTSIAGILFVLALSKGTLSHTIVANSGKIALTLVLAAIFLHERNNMLLRFGAFSLAILGIFFILI